MISAQYDYRIAAGHGVALASLNNIETHIGQQNRKTADGKLFAVGISSPVLDTFPVRTPLLSGRERGDGNINHEWNLQLVTYGARYLLFTYLTNMTVVSSAVTIYTRRHINGDYARYNAYLILPSREAGDITRIGRDTFTIRLRFTKLEAL